MAEGIFKHEVATYNLNGVVGASAGIYASPGMLASDLAVVVAQEHNITLSAHRSQQLTRALLDAADVVLVMTGSHYSAILDAGPAYLEKTYLLKEYGRKKIPTHADIADPIGGDIAVYRSALHEIREEIRQILPCIARILSQRV